MLRQQILPRIIRACARISGGVIAISVLWPGMSTSAKVQLNPTMSLAGALEIQVEALVLVDTIYLDSSIGALDGCTVIIFAESLLVAGGVPILPFEPPDTSEVVRIYRCLRTPVFNPTVAIVSIQVRTFPGTVLVTLNVDQIVRLARDSTIEFPARTLVRERTIELSEIGNAPVGGEIRRAISELISAFIDLYSQTHE